MRILRISTFSMREVLTKKKMTSDGLLGAERGEEGGGERRFVSFHITDFHKAKRQLLTWVASKDANAAGVDVFCFLDNQGYPQSIARGVECLMAVGVRDSCEAAAGLAFARLKEWAADRREWLFGHFGYDLAAETEPGAAGKGAAGSPPGPDPIGFPDLFFFVPQILVELSPTVIRIGCFEGSGEAIRSQIERIPVNADHTPDRVPI